MTAPVTSAVRQLRSEMGVSRRLFSRLTGYSERAIADWEAGKVLSPTSQARVREIQRLYAGLTRVMQPGFVVQWLETPNSAFDNLKPLEVIERGESDRIWRMIYFLESGVAS